MQRFGIDVANKFRRTVAIGGAAVFALFAAAPLSGSASAASYPTRPVRIIVPYGAGGIADVTMRMVAEKLADRLGQQFIIDNRPGAAGIVGIKAVVTSQPDGYTLAMIGGWICRDVDPDNISAVQSASIVIFTKTAP